MSLRLQPTARGAIVNAAAEAQTAVRLTRSRGQKIEAIKHYRRATGAGLAEAKDVVEEALRHG